MLITSLVFDLPVFMLQPVRAENVAYADENDSFGGSYTWEISAELFGIGGKQSGSFTCEFNFEPFVCGPAGTDLVPRGRVT